jgi:hypothetical protein
MRGKGGGRSRGIGFNQSSADELVRPHRISGPEDVCLRLLPFGDDAVQDASALRFLGIEHGTYANPCVLLELPEDGLCEYSIYRAVHDDFLFVAVASAARGKQGACSRKQPEAKDGSDPAHGHDFATGKIQLKPIIP